MPAERPIVAALSGGVDSATAAALLVAEGRRVVGVTMRLYDARGTSASAGGRCCGPRDIEDARRVCRHLGIPFYVVDLEEEFSRRVMDDFVEAYLTGETPNPCVRCNQHIKFTPLLRRARALGAEAIVTGHYARIEAGEGGRLRLRRGVDRDKDQSYFLFSMPQWELSAVRFPLGGLEKDEVRRVAQEHALPNADKPESQEICFVPDGDHAGFVARSALRRGRPAPGPGPIVDEEGRQLGTHRGLHRYTIGQRRGLGDVGGGRPAYVLRLDPAENAVVVGSRDRARRRSVRLRDVRWFVDAPSRPLETKVQVRHRAAPVPARVTARGDEADVELTTGGVVAAPGQAAVFYDGDTVLGGGWIAP